ncbi:MAG: serine/threonine protein kinase [Deltaproteobacteria bacterium]|jgi:serine/threonine-protein kinase|nr:serine/threonine protein kinase [Deltaproteobacteria bacterium]MBW2533978.1 serine/threonine protein kinase [Deltaproteobacteria bacterium]
MLEDFFGIIGTTLAGSFLVEEVIAEGGYAVVYRAEHVAFRAPVALKCLKLPKSMQADQRETFVESFREEAEILFHLSASIPEVVRPLHADALTVDDGSFVPYLAMEWVEGKPLDSIIILRERDGYPPLEIEELLTMLSPIAHALARAHRFEVPGGGVVEVTHCDLKPENIVISDADEHVRAKILDFGIAKARDLLAGGYGGLNDERRPFTPNYGAPEQWAPRQLGQTGPWTDVWGMALTLTECLTGRPVLEGDMRDMMDKVLDESRRPTPGSEGAPVSAEVEAVFERAMALEPRDRYGSIEAFWGALEAAAGAPLSFAGTPSDRQIEATASPSRNRLEGFGAAGEEALLELDDDADGGDLELNAPRRSSLAPGVEHPLDHTDGEFDSGEYELEPEGDDLEFAADGPASAPEYTGKPDSPEDSGVRRQLEFEMDEFGVPDDGPDSAPRTSPAVSGGPAISLAPDRDRKKVAPEPPPPEPAAEPPPEPQKSPAELAKDLARSGARREVASLARRLMFPAIVMALAFILTFIDMFTAGETGGFLMLGPIRVRWIAGLLALGGIAWAIWNVVVGQDEG